MYEVQDLSKWLDFNNLTCYKVNNDPKALIGYEGPQGFYKRYEGKFFNTRKSRRRTKRI